MTTTGTSRQRLEIRPANRNADTLLFLVIPTPIGRLRLAATPGGVVRIELPGANAEARMNVWLALHFPNARRLRGMSPILRRAAVELEGYFTGGVQRFSLPVELCGTSFQMAVWQHVAAIPFAETRSYGEIARAIGNAKALRAVGAAQGANPVPIVVPCHRVIGSDGTLTGYGGGLPTKRWLLEHERELAGLSLTTASWAARARRVDHRQRILPLGDGHEPTRP